MVSDVKAEWLGEPVSTNLLCPDFQVLQRVLLS